MKRMLAVCLFMTLCLHSNSSWGQNRIVISKELLCLYVITENFDTIFVAPIGCGMNYGNKTKVGDNKTPEGTFRVCEIQNSSNWRHDFKDGYGMRKGAYGPLFIRLKVSGYTGIGIHGTCFPETIGSRCSEGCIRMHNADLLKLISYIKVGTKCTILPDHTFRNPHTNVTINDFITYGKD